MVVQYVSDLHLEFSQNATYLEANPILPTGDVLVLAGDVTSLNHYKTRKLEKSLFKTLSKQFAQVYYIPGNHEFYRSLDARLLNEPFQEALLPNVFLLNNTTRTYGGVRFVFSTLWSQIDQINEFVFKHNMADFQLITYRGRMLHPSVYTRDLHGPARAFLQRELSRSVAEPTVVVTHHMPSLRCVHPRHMGSVLEQGFANDLDDLILDTQPAYWVYGHSHANRPPIQIGQTQLLTNMLGYSWMHENGDYQNPAVFSL